MKQLLLFALVAFTVATASAQCKYDLNKVDPISGEKEQRILFQANVFFTMALYNKGDGYRVESYVRMPGKQQFTVPVGHKLNIKLANGKVLTLQNVNETIPKVNVIGTDIVTDYAMSYTITKEQLKEIAASGIVFMRTWLQEENYYDYEFKKKDTEKSIASAGCIVNG